MQILFIILCIIYIISLIIYNKNNKKILNKYIERKKEEIHQQLLEKEKDKEKLEYVLEACKKEKKDIEEQIKEKLQLRKEILDELEDFELVQKEKIQNRIFEYESSKRKTVDLLLSQESERKKQVAMESHNFFLAELQKEQTIKQNELFQIQEEIETFRKKQEAINQEILRQRELEEKADFYRVCLPNEAITDIAELQIVRQKLKKPEILDKIIYDTYVAKPVLEMIKRVLQNATCSGIYKITCQKTKEIYIGKSTDIKNRWQQHCKTAFNCGTIASSLLHRKMQQYGIENFTFELLEVVPKDKLSEREKFYIDFYKTKETGLNERNG